MTEVRLEGEEYTLGEQIQYTDIWGNDNYLQFMYERLLLAKRITQPMMEAFGYTVTAHIVPIIYKSIRRNFWI